MNPNNKISQTGNSVLGVVNKTNFYCKGNFNPYREKHLKIMTNSPNPLDKYGDDDILSTILRWSLYFGAFFQLACIMASIFMPSHDKDDVDNLEVLFILQLTSL